MAYRVRAEKRDEALSRQPLQAAYVGSVAEQFETSRLLAMLVVRKLTKDVAGVDHGPLVESAHGVISRAIRDGVPLDSLTFEFGDIPNFPADAKRTIDLSEGDLNHLLVDLEARLCDAVPKTVKQSAVLLLDSLKAEWVEGQRHEADQTDEYKKRLYRRWSPALPLFELELLIAAHAGQIANDWLRRGADALDEQQALAEALTRLHARACQVGNEVLVLLVNGLADGALSRWRTLHELAVVSWFLAEHGNDTAKRYLDHVDIDAVRLARTFRDPQVERSWRPFSDEEWTAIVARADRLCDVYGPEYRREYGWAAKALANQAPKFSDIERAVKFSVARPQYKMASDAVHAGPKGMLVTLGNLLGDESLLLVGPSNAGLDEPGRLAATSLSQATTALLTASPFMDGLVWARAIGDLSSEVVDAFDAAATRLVDDHERIERRLRRRQRR